MLEATMILYYVFENGAMGLLIISEEKCSQSLNFGNKPGYKHVIMSAPVVPCCLYSSTGVAWNALKLYAFCCNLSGSFKLVVSCCESLLCTMKSISLRNETIDGRFYSSLLYTLIGESREIWITLPKEVENKLTILNLKTISLVLSWLKCALHSCGIRNFCLFLFNLALDLKPSCQPWCWDWWHSFWSEMN